MQFCHNKMPQMSHALRECAIDMLTAGMSTRAVAREFNINFAHNCRPRTCNYTSPGPPHPASLPVGSSETSHPDSRWNSYYNQIIFAQTVRNCLREAHLCARHPCQDLDLTVVWRLNRLQWAMLTFNGHCHSGEVCSSRMNPGFKYTGQMADSVACTALWANGLLMSTLWTECPMVVGLWYGHTYAMDNEDYCILWMEIWMDRDTMTRSWGPLCH